MGTSLEMRLAAAAAIGTVVMVMYLFALLLAARMYGRIRRMRRSNFVDSWRDYLASDKPPYTARVLSLYQDEVLYLVRCWNLEFERGLEALAEREWLDTGGWRPGKDPAGWTPPGRIQRLRDIAYSTGLSHAALALAFRSRTREEQIAGIQCLGGLGRTEVFDRLEPLLGTDDQDVSLAAFESLIRIDTARMQPRLGSEICGHPMWPDHALTRLIRFLGGDDREAVVHQVWADGAGPCRARVIAAMEAFRHAGASRLLQTELATATRFDQIAGLMYAVRDESHVQLIEDAISNLKRMHEEGRRPSKTAPPWHTDFLRSLDGWKPLGLGGMA